MYQHALLHYTTFEGDKGNNKQQLLIAACPAEGVSVAIQSQVNVHSCTAEVFIAA